MSSFPGSPRLLKGGIVLVDPESGTVKNTIVLQYNPHTLTRSLQVQGIGGEGGSRSEALRLTGPPVETIKLEVEIDATDQLEVADSTATQLGIHPQLAALETIIYPKSDDILENARLAGSGTLEIVPMQALLTLFVWSKERIVPVRLTEFSVTEEAFDPALNPIRAKISLGMRVLTIDDLESDHKGSSLYMAHHQRKERLAKMSRSGVLSALGIGGIP